MKNKTYLPIFLSIATAVGIFIGSNLDYSNKTAMLFGSSPQEAKIKRLIDFIEYDYVEKINTDSLLDGTIKNIVEKLDPHSVYIPAKNHDEITEKMNGKFVGIGIQFRMLRDSLSVIKTIKNGPTEKAGIKAGDRILLANKDTLFGKQMNTDSIVSRLKGKL
ncbi:MAG TPA: PDZ domain-containing protein, partial [Bacteroidia bacterium]|nr:PDZ domain-containing protein [Bacteroidia bacterium]